MVYITTPNKGHKEPIINNDILRRPTQENMAFKKKDKLYSFFPAKKATFKTQNFQPLSKQPSLLANRQLKTTVQLTHTYLNLSNTKSHDVLSTSYTNRASTT